MIADWALHDKGDGNPHAHILLTVRGINEKEGWQLKQKSVFANGRDENGKQKTRVRQGKGTEYLWERISIPANDWNEHDKCEEWRKSWAEHCNNYLPPELHIDHRSYERQGIDMEPTVHEGVTARKMEASGKTADRCKMNREIKQRNQIRQKIAEQFSELSKIILLKVRELYERITGIFTKEKSRRTDTDSLIREIRSADAKESAAGKERADREDERRRLDLERERASEREIYTGIRAYVRGCRKNRGYY